MKTKKLYNEAKNKPGPALPEPPPLVKPRTAPIRKASFAKHAATILAVLAIVLYVNTLTLDFALDDRLMITENQFTKKGISGIREIMTNDAFTGFYGKQRKLVAGGRYRPLSQVVFALEYQFFGPRAFPGHLVNLVLYALTCVFLFYLLKKLLVKFEKPPWYFSLPFIAAVLYTAHPLHTEVVANIKGLDEILSFLGCLCTLYFTLRFLEKSRAVSLVLAGISFLLALLSKESAVTFLAVIPLVLYFFYRVSIRQYLYSMVPVFLASVIYIGLRVNALGFFLGQQAITELLNNPYVGVSPADKSATIFYTWGKYLQLLVFPHPLTHDYYPKQVPILNWQDLRVLFSFLAFLVLGIFAVLNLRKRSIPAFSVLFFMITFSISSNLFFNVGAFMNERFMFVPSLGFALAAAYLVTRKAGKYFRNPVGYQRAAGIFLLFVLTLYSIKTISRNFTWENDFTLFSTDVKVSANSTKCNVSAGGMYLEKARLETDSLKKSQLLETAQKYLAKGVNIYPGNSAGWVLLGNVMLEEKKYDLAREYYDNCLNIYNSQPEALAKLAYVGQQVAKAENYALSARCFRTLLRYKPDNKEYYYYLADAIANLNQPDSGIAILQKLILQDSTYAMAYAKMGEIYGKILNDFGRSLTYLHKAVRLNPKDISANENLGIVYGIRKEYKTSLEYFGKALALDSTIPRIYLNIGNTYTMMGNKQAAQEYFNKAAQVQRNAK